MSPSAMEAHHTICTFFHHSLNHNVLKLVIYFGGQFTPQNISVSVLSLEVDLSRALRTRPLP